MIVYLGFNFLVIEISVSLSLKLFIVVLANEILVRRVIIVCPLKL